VKRNKLLTLLIGVCLIGALLILPLMSACAPEEVVGPGEEEEEEEQEEEEEEEEMGVVKIGMFGALTGPVGVHGLPLLQGMQILKKHVDEDGGFLVNGKRYTFEIVSFDTRYDPKLCVTGAEKMLEAGVIGTVGAPMNIAGVFAAHEVLGPANIPQMCHLIDWEVGKAKMNNVFEYETVMERKIYVAQFLGPDGLDIDTIAWMEASDMPDMVDLYSEEALTKYGIETVGREAFDVDCTDFYTMLAKLREKDPDVLYNACNATLSALILKQKAELGWLAQTVGVDCLSAAGAPAIRLAGEAVDGHIESVWNFEPAKVYEDWEAEILGVDPAQHKRWVDTSLDMFGIDWYSPYQGTGYTWAQLLIQACQRVGSVTDQAAILDALENTPPTSGVELLVELTPDCHHWIVRWIWVMFTITNPEVGSFVTESFGGSRPIAHCGADWELIMKKDIKLKDIRAGLVPGTQAYGVGY